MFAHWSCDWRHFDILKIVSLCLNISTAVELMSCTRVKFTTEVCSFDMFGTVSWLSLHFQIFCERAADFCSTCSTIFAVWTPLRTAQRLLMFSALPMCADCIIDFAKGPYIDSKRILSSPHVSRNPHLLNRIHLLQSSTISCLQ